MRAIIENSHGGPEVLAISEAPPPYPDPTKFSSAFTLLESTAPTPCNAVDSTRRPPVRVRSTASKWQV